MTEYPNPVTGLKREQRLAAANKLEEYGWAIVRYAQRVQRACAKPGEPNELAATTWWNRVLARRSVFAELRTKYLAPSS